MNPRDWAFCVVGGTFCVAANNYVLYKLCLEGLHSGQTFFSSEKRVSSDEFLERFRLWAQAAFIYGVCVLLLALLMKWGVAKDEAIDALIITAVNLFQVFRMALVLDAPNVRSGLNRLVFLHRRADRAMDRERVS